MSTDRGERSEELVEARLGRYELVRRIAYGGMAEIFLARDTGVQGVTRNVVVKLILPNITEDRAFVDMFLDEARIAARLGHQNIVHVYDFGEAGGRYYIAMELVDGLSLSALLNAARPDPIPVAHVARIGSLVAQALYYAHTMRNEAGEPMHVVHRDVSPQNVLLSFDGQVKLVDFGIAKAADQIHHTEAGVLKGKYAYMAPEQCLGSPYDHRVDIFSLGTVLHEALTGSRLFKRENAFQTMQAVTSEPIPPPSVKHPGLPSRLDEIVLRALARDPDKRYPSADELAMDLEVLLQEERLISNQILLGRYITSLTQRGEGATGDDWAPSSGETGSAPSWSGASGLGPAASGSGVSRLRRVEPPGGRAPDEQAASPLEPPPVVSGPRAPNSHEAEGDTQEHEVSDIRAIHDEALLPAPPVGGPDRTTEEPVLFPAPARPAASPSAEPSAAEDPGLEVDLSGVVPSAPRTSSEPAVTEDIWPPVATVPEARADRDDSDAALRPRTETDLPAAGDDEPEPDAAGSPDPAATVRTTPVVPAPALPLSGEVGGFTVEPDESDAALARLIRPHARWLVLAGALVALTTFVVLAAVLGLRSVVRPDDSAPDRAPGPGQELHWGAGGDPGGTEPGAPRHGAGLAGGPDGVAPTEAPLAGPAKGTLVVGLAPGDRLEVGGSEVEAGAAGRGIALEPGDHPVRVDRPGHQPWTKVARVEAGGVTSLTPEPRAQPRAEPSRPGRLYVNSRPWSRVYLNGRAVGTTPIVSQQVEPGRMSLKLVAQDGREERRTVRVRPGGTAKVFVEF